MGMYNKNTQSAKAKERSLIEQNEVEQDWIKARLVDDPHPFFREVAERFGLKQDHTVNYSRQCLKPKICCLFLLDGKLIICQPIADPFSFRQCHYFCNQYELLGKYCA